MSDIAHKIFDESSTSYKFEETPVTEETLRELTRLFQLAPTAFNCTPVRVAYYTSAESKEQIASAGQYSNKPNTEVAPAVAVLSIDQKWIEKMDKLNPQYNTEALTGILGQYPGAIEATGNLNGHIQAGYFIIAARALGLGAGPMTGFDFEKLDQLVGNPDHKAFVVIRLGYAAENPEYKRAARLSFEECATIL